MLRGEPAGEKERDASAEHNAGADRKSQFREAKPSFSHDNQSWLYSKKGQTEKGLSGDRKAGRQNCLRCSAPYANLTADLIEHTSQHQASAAIRIRRKKDSLRPAPFKFQLASEVLFLCLAFLVLPVISIAAESDQALAAKIAGVWLGRDIVYSSNAEVETTYRADGTMSRFVKFSEDRRGYKLSVRGRWKVEQGQLVSVRRSFSGETERSVDEIIAVTDKNLLLRAENGRLIHLIRK